MHRHLAYALFALALLPGCEGALAVDSLTSGGGSPPMMPPATPPTEGGGGGVTILPDTDAGPGGAADAGPPGCMPQCDGRFCGPDGCGGVCGVCANDDVCDELGQCVPQGSPLCPPTGSEGTSPGSVAPDLDFPLLGGGSSSVRDTCANRTTLIYFFAEWCGYCRTWMRDDAVNLANELSGDDFQLIIYYGENYGYGTPTESDAIRIRSEYGLGDIPIVMGNESAFLQTFRRAGPQVKLLMEEGNVIAAPIGPMSDSTVRSVARR